MTVIYAVNPEEYRGNPATRRLGASVNESLATGIEYALHGCEPVRIAILACGLGEFAADVRTRHPLSHQHIAAVHRIVDMLRPPDLRWLGFTTSRA